MKRKYFVRGLGVGVLFGALIMFAAYMTSGKNRMSDEDIMKRAQELGMVKKSEYVLESDVSSEETTTEHITTEAATEETTTEAPTTQPQWCRQQQKKQRQKLLQQRNRVLQLKQLLQLQVV